MEPLTVEVNSKFNDYKVKLSKDPWSVSERTAKVSTKIEHMHCG